MRYLYIFFSFTILCTSSFSTERDEFFIGDTNCRVFNPHPQPDEKVTWTGECKDGYADGNGILEWYVQGKFHSRYEGRMEKGRAHGSGVYSFSSNARYEGGFKNGKRDGKGVMINPDGIKIAAAFADDDVIGEVEATFPKGSWYRGGWKNGKPEGKGKYKYPEGIVYEGEFKSGQRDGMGAATYPNGTRYEGTWRQGKYDGQGTLIRSDGSRVNGVFKDGVRIDKTSEETSLARYAASNFLRSRSAIKEYIEKYDSAQDHKAFAQSSLHAWGWSAGHSTINEAKEAALNNCNARVDAEEPPCVVFEVDGNVVKEAAADEWAIAAKYSSKYIHTILQSVDPLDKPRFDDAVQRLTRLARPSKRISQTAASYYERGSALLNEGKFEAAQESFRKAVSAAPGAQEAHSALAIAMLKVGQFLDAESAVRSALYLDHLNRRLWTIEAIIQSKMGSKELAKSALLAAYETGAGNKRLKTLDAYKEASESEDNIALKEVYNAVVQRIELRQNAERAAQKQSAGTRGNFSAESANSDKPKSPTVNFSSCAAPAYPKSALRNNQQGAVRLAFLIGEIGEVLDSYVIRSSGFWDLDEAAMSGVFLCQFSVPEKGVTSKMNWTAMEYVWKLE